MFITIFSSWMKKFRTNVSLMISNVVVSIHVPICCFSLVYDGFEYGFVDMHAQVDVWKASHILIHIMHAQILYINSRSACVRLSDTTFCNGNMRGRFCNPSLCLFVRSSVRPFVRSSVCLDVFFSPCLKLTKMKKQKKKSLKVRSSVYPDINEETKEKIKNKRSVEPVCMYVCMYF